MKPEPADQERPRYRVAGGILLGARGRRPMALADNEETETVETSRSYQSSAQIIGFPWRIGFGIFSIGPIVGPRTGILADEWVGQLRSYSTMETGAQVWLIEKFTESVSFNSGTGLFYRNGLYIDGSAYVFATGFDDLTDYNVAPTFNAVTGAVTAATVAWLISIVKEHNGEYYLYDAWRMGNPPQAIAGFVADFSTVDGEPNDFNIKNPL